MKYNFLATEINQLRSDPPGAEKRKEILHILIKHNAAHPTDINETRRCRKILFLPIYISLLNDHAGTCTLGWNNAIESTDKSILIRTPQQISDEEAETPLCTSPGLPDPRALLPFAPFRPYGTCGGICAFDASCLGSGLWPECSCGGIDFQQ